MADQKMANALSSVSFCKPCTATHAAIFLCRATASPATACASCSCCATGVTAGLHSSQVHCNSLLHWPALLPSLINACFCIYYLDFLLLTACCPAAAQVGVGIREDVRHLAADYSVFMCVSQVLPFHLLAVNMFLCCCSGWRWHSGGCAPPSSRLRHNNALSGGPVRRGSSRGTTAATAKSAAAKQHCCCWWCWRRLFWSSSVCWCLCCWKKGWQH